MLSFFLRVWKNTVGKSCSSPFPLPPHPSGGVFGSSGLLLLLENSVAENEGGDEHWERGRMGHGPLLVLEASALPVSCGKRVQLISIDLMSRDVFQRVNVFIGFLSFCCKK